MAENGSIAERRQQIGQILQRVVGSAEPLPTDEGRWALAAEGGPDLALQLSDDGLMLSVFAAVGALPPGDPAAVMRLALAINLDPAFVGAAAIGLDCDTDRLMLRQTIDSSRFEDRFIASVLADMIELSHTAIDVLAASAPSGAAADAV